jgi:hypothetical protein
MMHIEECLMKFLWVLLSPALFVMLGIAQCSPPDGDGDGYSEAEGDCDDANANTYPGATEVCDLMDNDCDEVIDEGYDHTEVWYVDADADGYGEGLAQGDGCTTPPGYAANFDDCDDANAAINPGATELCDGQDNNCDGTTDDEDGDGNSFCWGGSVPADCDDSNPAVYYGAVEVCDGLDNDCDHQIDELIDSCPTTDRDGDGYSVGEGDCDDSWSAVYPGAAEVCNGVDNDCDGVIDEGCE